MDSRQLLSSADIGARLGLSEKAARALLWRHAPVGTMRTNDGRWYLPIECLDELRRAMNKAA